MVLNTATVVLLFFVVVLVVRFVLFFFFQVFVVFRMGVFGFVLGGGCNLVGNGTTVLLLSLLCSWCGLQAVFFFSVLFAPRLAEDVAVFLNIFGTLD